MNPRTLFGAIATATAIAACAAAFFWLWSREQTLQLLAASVDEELALNHRLVARVKQPVVPPAATVAQASAPTPPAASPTAAAPTPALADSAAKLSRILREMPEYAPCLRASRQRAAMQFYGEWFSQLNVTPERLLEIKQCIADNFAQQQEAFAEMMGAGLNVRSREYLDGVRRLTEESNARLQQVLTAEEFQSYRTFQEASTWTRHLPEIDAYFDDRGVARLGPAERRAFSEACVKARELAREDRDVPPVAGYRLSNERISALAAPALAPAQRAALSGYLDYMSQRSRLMGQLLHPDAPDSISYTRSPLF